MGSATARGASQHIRGQQIVRWGRRRATWSTLCCAAAAASALASLPCFGDQLSSEASPTGAPPSGMRGSRPGRSHPGTGGTAQSLRWSRTGSGGHCSPGWQPAGTCPAGTRGSQVAGDALPVSGPQLSPAFRRQKHTQIMPAVLELLQLGRRGAVLLKAPAWASRW